MTSPALRDLQASFWRSLHGGTADPGLTRVVRPSRSLDPAGRIEVYQSMYFWRLREVLREDFPKLHEALADAFDGLARDYLTAHPSENPSVRLVGDRLPAFLAGHAIGRERPWLVDLARLERARVDVFDAFDAVPLLASDLRAVPPDAWADLGFELVPALGVVACEWPAHEVWNAPDTCPAACGATIRVWRQEFVVFHAAMDPIETAAFAALRAGASFGDVCGVVADHVEPETAPAEAGGLLARWIEDGLVARLRSS